MRQSTVDKIYKRIRAKYPDIKSGTKIEALVRKSIFRRKLLVAFSLYALSILSYLFFSNTDLFFKDPQSATCETICALAKILGGISAIASVMIFAKSLHDPLTPSESRELQEKETYEKTGHK